jgi:hypothetical protein
MYRARLKLDSILKPNSPFILFALTITTLLPISRLIILITSIKAGYTSLANFDLSRQTHENRVALSIITI